MLFSAHVNRLVPVIVVYIVVDPGVTTQVTEENTSHHSDDTTEVSTDIDESFVYQPSSNKLHKAKTKDPITD